jgi:hypothetical protein
MPAKGTVAVSLQMKEKQAITKEVATRYCRAKKKEKVKMLDELVATTGYNRSYATRALRLALKVPVKSKASPKRRRRRERLYDDKVVAAVTKVWVTLDMPCGKRLGPYLKTIVPILEGFNELDLDNDTRDKLISMSAATIDRLMKAERRRIDLKRRSGTKPGSLLKHQIPVRTFCDWDEDKPGFLEIDLVAHNGGNPRGDFCQTLDVTDIHSTWTETRAIKNKAQVWVFEALMDISCGLPFDINGIDSDNGSEFINNHLVKYCQDNEITFTRSRPLRKNDNCFIEQKNYTVVRKTVGYARHDTQEELDLLNEIYVHLRRYTNFFQPTMKLIEKTRTGSKIKKVYDQPKTPYQRLMDCPQITEESKAKLKSEFESINPAALKRELNALVDELFKVNINKNKSMRKEETPLTLSSTF